MGTICVGFFDDVSLVCPTLDLIFTTTFHLRLNPCIITLLTVWKTINEEILQKLMNVHELSHG